MNTLLSPASTVMYARGRANAAQERHRKHVMTAEHCPCVRNGWCTREVALDREAASAWLEVETVERYAARQTVTEGR